MPCPPSLSNQNYLIASSTTRPTGFNLNVGTRVFEADTGREVLWDGTGWVIMSEPSVTGWANPFTGITGGTPTWAGSYFRSNGWLWYQGRLIFGGAPSGVAAAAYTLPITPALDDGASHTIIYRDAGTASYGGLGVPGGTSVALNAANAAGTYVTTTAISTTVPFTFGASDAIDISGYYRMTTRYS